MTNRIKAARKAELLRLELLDLITYDPRFNGEEDGKLDEAGALHAAVDWVFRDSTDEFRADLCTRLIEGAWTKTRFTDILQGVLA